MFLLLAILTAVAVLGTLAPLSRSKVWWLRAWDFPRVQLCVLGLIVVTGVALRGFADARENGLAAFAALAAVYQLWWIRGFTPLHRREVPAAAAGATGPRVRLFTANVLQTNRQAERLRALVRTHAPDVLLLLEADAWWTEQWTEFRRELPHVLACPRDNFYGMLLLSRWPLEDARVQHLVEPDVPSMHAALRLPDGTIVRLIALHPAPPSPTENSASTERDAELLRVASSLENEERPAIVLGDLNDVAWSQTTQLFRKISGLLDPRVGRGFFNTFPATVPFFRWPVDHLFHSAHFSLASLRRLPAFGSDHFPVFAELVLDGRAEHRVPPRPRRGERGEAREDSASAPPREPVHVPRAAHADSRS